MGGLHGISFRGKVSRIPELLNASRIGQVIDLPRIGEPKPTLRDVVQIAKRINRGDGIKLLAQMNLFLGVAAIDHRLTKFNHPWTNGQVERMKPIHPARTN